MRTSPNGERRNGVAISDEDQNMPVWIHATASFYKKLNRVAKECELSRYEALSRGLNALLNEFRVQKSRLNTAVKSPNQSNAFRRTMGQVSRKYWATLTPEEKRQRAQRSARARWGKRTLER
jgi:hypothetical protein